MSFKTRRLESMTRAGKAITCPQCDKTTYKLKDIQDGYCRACKAWTAPMVVVTYSGKRSALGPALAAGIREMDGRGYSIETQVAMMGQESPWRLPNWSVPRDGIVVTYRLRDIQESVPLEA